MEVILSIIGSITTIIGALVSYYFYIRSKIMEITNTAINIAEDSNKIKHEKMQVAIQEIRKVLPTITKLFISDSMIESIIQHAFDKIEEYVSKQNKK